jgi:hypothetical protein
MNLHAADDLQGLLAGLRSVTLPLRDRLNWSGPFGIGTYLPATLASHLVSRAGESDRRALRRFYVGEGLDPFTFNAFPYGGFQDDGLKERVFEPTWDRRERLSYTLDVARLAEDLARSCGCVEEGSHLSISTHCGRFGPWPEDGAQRRVAETTYLECASALGDIASFGGTPILLALEAEPRSSAGDTQELSGFMEDLGGFTWGGGILGTCLDACHAAVEFEEPGAALARSAAHGPLAKIQFSSALSLRHPGSRPEGRRLLLEMDEPRFLHQVTGRTAEGRLLHARDLPDLARLLEGDGAGNADKDAAEAWLGCDAWRCHFHVPVDLESVGELETTRRDADLILEAVLADPEIWGTTELHLEIETYTWDVLPGVARGPGDLVDGLEREYEHVISRLRAAGWSTSDDAPGAA